MPRSQVARYPAPRGGDARRLRLRLRPRAARAPGSHRAGARRPQGYRARARRYPPARRRDSRPVTRSPDEIRLDASEFRLLRDLFNAYSGLQFGPEARPVLERRLRERLALHHLSSFSEYYQRFFQDNSRAEIDEAIELVAIHE